MLDENISWREHIKAVENKLSKGASLQISAVFGFRYQAGCNRVF